MILGSTMKDTYYRYHDPDYSATDPVCASKTPKENKQD